MVKAEQVRELLEKQRQEYIKTPHYPTIMLLGASGCGKSTLINTLFNVDVARTAIGEAGTHGFDYYEAKENGAAINFVDSEGWETDTDYHKFIDNLKNYLEETKKNGKTIQMIWYCISAQASKIQDIDLNILKEITQIGKFSSKLCVVITKCDEDDINGSAAASFKEEIHKVLPHIECFQVSDKDNINRELDTDKLMEWTENALDDETQQEMFIAAQTFDIGAKRKKAQKRVLGYAGTAAGIGAAPIPFSDSVALITLQVTMMSHISNIYGFSFKDQVVADGITSGLVSQVGKFVVKFMVKNLIPEILKFVPVLGTVIGGMSNAVVAGGITYGIGRGLINEYEKMYKKVLNGEDTSTFNLGEIFKNEEFKNTVTSEMLKYTQKNKED